MNELKHYGVKGMHWGVRRYQPYPSDKTIFVSGSSKTQTKGSPYKRRRLHKDIRKNLKSHMKEGNKIIVGDAPGIDRQVQKYLKRKNYKHVEVYGPGEKVRYSANKKWKTNPIHDKRTKEGSKAWLAAKDKAMANAATQGLAVVLDKGAKATRKNIDRLTKQGKDVDIFELSSKGRKYDKWIRNKFGKIRIE